MAARAPAPMTGEDCANLIALFNSGWGEERLAEHFDIAVDDVQQVLRTESRRRGLTMREAEERLVVMKVTPRAYVVRAVEAGDGQPKFAHHERHVSAVMAQGGFAAWSESLVDGRLRLGLPMLRPVFDAPPPVATKAKRRRAR